MFALPLSDTRPPVVEAYYGTQVQMVESYWCPGPWPWQWFRTCRRTVTKWCYNFTWIKEYRWLIACYIEACENGVLYSYWAFCFGLFGSATFYNIQKCYDNELSRKGECGAGGFVEGP
jgi:hypothetical protein